MPSDNGAARNINQVNECRISLACSCVRIQYRLRAVTLSRRKCFEIVGKRESVKSTEYFSRDWEAARDASKIRALIISLG